VSCDEFLEMGGKTCDVFGSAKHALDLGEDFFL